MKKIFLILMVSTISQLALGQKPTDQKWRGQEVDVDTFRTNHRGPGHGFWFGSGDSGFFQILLGNRPYVFKPNGQRDSVALYSDLGGSSPGVFDTIWVYSIHHDYRGHGTPFIREGVDWEIGDTAGGGKESWQWYNTIAGAIGNDLIKVPGHFQKQPSIYVGSSGDFRVAPYHYTGVGDDTNWQFHAEVTVDITWGATPRSVPGVWGINSDQCTFDLQFYIWDNAHSCYSWITVGEGVWSDNAYPFPYTPGYRYQAVVPIAMNHADYSVLKNGYWGYHPTPWVMGMDSAGVCQWRITSNCDPYFGHDDPVTGADYLKLWKVHVWSQTNYAGAGPAVIAWNTFEFIDTLWNHVFKNDVTVQGNATVQKQLTAYGGLQIGGILTDTTQGGSNLRADTIAGVIYIANKYGVISAIYNVCGDTVQHKWYYPPQDDTLAGLQNLPYNGLTGQRFSVFLPDSGASFQQSANGDTLRIRAIAGSGASGASYYTMPAEKPPASPSSKNDEFDQANGTVPDTGNGTHKWQFLGKPSRTGISIIEHYGVLSFIDSCPAVPLYFWLGQKITDTVFTITVRLEPLLTSGTYPGVGIFVYDSSSQKGADFRETSNNQDLSGRYQCYDHFTTYNSSLTNVMYNRQAEVPMTRYFRIEKTLNRTLNVYRSSDGLSWWRLTTETAVGNVENLGDHINWVGIFVGGETSTGTVAGGDFFWFRYNWTADFDATIYH